MKKKVFGRQFKRDIDERKALFRGLINSLILEEKIKTTEAKAKAIKAQIDKIITKAKKGESARNFLQKLVYKDLLDKLIKDIAPRFEKRTGGYTRISRIGERLSDKAQMVLVEWVEGKKLDSVISENQDKKAQKKEIKNKKAEDLKMLGREQN